MFKVIQSYRILSVLSLDVVAGAIAGALFFAKIFSVVIRPCELIALGFTVWIIYTADHLRDAKSLDHRASTDRHHFHQVHYYKLIKVLVVIILLDAAAVVFIPTQVILWGVVLVTAVSVYLVVHRSLGFFKEVFVAMMYTGGIILPTLSMTRIDVNVIHYLLILHFSILALINLLMFSWFDRELDQRDRQQSFVTIIGERVTGKFIWLLVFIQLLLTLVQLYWRQYNWAALLLGTMGLMLFAIFLFRKSLEKQDYYRFLGDAVFIIPIFYLV